MSCVRQPNTGQHWTQSDSKDNGLRALQLLGIVRKGSLGMWTECWDDKSEMNRVPDGLALR
jgi:hypothetical protein